LRGEVDTMNIFLISPVKLANDDNTGVIRKLVSNLEADGHKVHWPLRDTKQDAKAIDICRENVAAMRKAHIIYIYFMPGSAGSKFDLGAAFAMGKPIYIVNDVQPTEEKSFENLLLQWEECE